MVDAPHFSDATFAFLRDLAENNDRDWFKANKSRYESDLKDPAIRFILAMGERLDALSPSLRADPRPVGGSMFRIYRDVRFSKDKSPYKTHVGIQFRHAAGKDAHAPGLYLHIEPDECFMGLGSWRPASPAVRAIREAMVEGPDAWRAAVAALDEGPLSLAGDALKRIPRGFDKEHPLADDLRRKDFIATATLDPADIRRADLPDRLLERAMAGRPLLQFLCDALGVAR